MSTASESARAAAKSKVERLTRADPRERVDASGYSPEGFMHGDIQTGPRPISRRQFRRGGKVAGEASPARADRKPRAAGGALTANSLINRMRVKKPTETDRPPAMSPLMIRDYVPEPVASGLIGPVQVRASGIVTLR